MSHQMLAPETLAHAVGYSHGVLASHGRLLVVSGQIGWDRDAKLVSADFVPQFGQALANIIEVVRAGGGQPSDVVRLTIYVTDKTLYSAQLKEVGRVYRAHFEKHFPAMALIEVAGLLEPGALVEIEATAVVPDQR